MRRRSPRPPRARTGCVRRARSRSDAAVEIEEDGGSESDAEEWLDEMDDEDED